MNQIIYKKIQSIKKLILPSDKVLIVTRPGVFNKSGAENIFKQMFSENLVFYFTNFELNPKLKDLKTGIDTFKNTNINKIISCGGGSCIDMGKLLSFFLQAPFSPDGYLCDQDLEHNNVMDHIAIPTTAGTGSESTQFAVLYNKKQKYSISKQILLPQCAVLDHRLLNSLPRYIRACSGIDALCQCIESFWSVNSIERSKRYAKKGIELILNNFVESIESNNIKILKNMLLASNYSGKAINISKTTGPHALSYYLTTNFNIPHGHAVALCFNEFFNINYNVNVHNCNDKRGFEYVVNIIDELFSLLGVNTVAEAQKLFLSLMKRSGLETDLTKMTGLTFDDLLKHANHERLKNNPVRIMDFYA